MEEFYTSAFQSTSTYESGAFLFEDFPKTEEPVYILGEVYSTLYDLDELRHDVLSRIWLTYRKGFAPIGGTGPQTDTGWGCMLRCGQMMLAQALMLNHTGRAWRWNKSDAQPTYKKILKLFQDKKKSCYSIHQIASMGVSEGKLVGQWFGPNTIAQVLKKLVIYDDWNKLAVHVALDNTVIIDDIKEMCKSSPDSSAINVKIQSENGTELSVSPARQTVLEHPLATSSHKVNGLEAGERCGSLNNDKDWRPLLLVIPLRLGLSEINQVYVDNLKKCFTLKQSVGIIGGKPNHAHWFIGNVGDQLVYLDPHTTQPVVDLINSEETDDSYHCPYSSRMNVNHLDPSVALGFFCKTELDFDELCQRIKDTIIGKNKTPMFELHKSHPEHWPPFQPFPNQSGTNTEFTLVDEKQEDTDEDYVLV